MLSRNGAFLWTVFSMAQLISSFSSGSSHSWTSICTVSCLSLYSSSQYSFHLWHTILGPVSFLPALCLIATVHSLNGLVRFLTDWKTVLLLPFFAFYILVHCTVNWFNPVCPFELHFAVSGIHLAIFPLLPSSSLSVRRCDWESSYCIWYNPFVVCLCSIYYSVFQLLPQIIRRVWSTSYL